MKETLLWLDDERDPHNRNINWLSYSPIGEDVNIIWVKNYKEFVNYISTHELPKAICFDHDLGEIKSGYDCARWLVDFCLKKELDIPRWVCQSANPVGRQNIDSILFNYVKFRMNNKMS